jgi:hypothetical protein
MSDWRIKLTNQVSKRPLLKAGRNDKVLLNLFLLNLFLLRYILSKFMKGVSCEKSFSLLKNSAV